jgi:hypothetical protein
MRSIRPRAPERGDLDIGHPIAAAEHIAALATHLGFSVVDTGPLITVRYLDPFAML